MRVLSLFSGIEAASVAWRPLGWQCVGVAEIDPFPCAVLAHHYPDVPNLGSVTDITDEQIAALGSIDVVVGGSPCQDLSVAGKRAGLAGERSGLFHEQLRIFHAARHLCGARFLVWENVPGAFSSHAGRDFAVVVGAMAGCRVDVPEDGWGTEGVALGEHGLVEWAVLDAQWFGVAQRRRRVFAVLDAGDWSSRPPILLEPDSMRGNLAPSREAGERTSVCPTLRAGGNRTGGDRPPGTDVDTCESLIVAHTLRAEGFDASEDGTGRGTPLVPVAVPLQEVGKRTGVSTTDPRAGIGIGVDGDPMFTLQAGAQHGVAIAAPVPIQNATRGKDQNGTGPQALVQQPYTLAIRGRGDSHDLEYRQDGTANALLTPNGGRGGIGVGAIAFDTTQITSAANRSNPQPGDPCHTLAGGAHPPAVAFMADDYKDGGYEECDTARPLTTSADRTRAAPVIAFRGKDYGADAGEVAPTLRGMGHDGSHANGGGQVAVCIHADAVGRTGDALTPSVDAEGRVRLRPPGVGIASDGTTYSLVATGQPHAVAFESRFARNGRGAPSDVVPPLKAQSGETGKGDAAPLVVAPSLTASNDPSRSPQSSEVTQQVGAVYASAMQVRRLTPVECCRLQGFPDDYLLQVPWRGKTPPPDGPMYKALGNSMAVPVMAWIGQQIAVAARYNEAAA